MSNASREQYKEMQKALANINTRRGSDPNKTKGFYSEVVNSYEANINNIDAGIKARQVVIDNNGPADAKIKYSGGNYGRDIQDKCGYSFSKHKSNLSSGKYDGQIYRINKEHEIFSNPKHLEELTRIAKERNIKIVASSTTEKEMYNLAYAAHLEGQVREKIGFDNKAPISAGLYTKSKEVARATKKTTEKTKEIGIDGVEGAKVALIDATPALVHQGAKDVINVVKGDVSVSDAAVDMAKSTGTVVVTGAATNIVKKQVNKAVERVNIKVGTQFVDTNVVGKVVGIAISLKDCTKQFVDGEIESSEYLIRVLEDGTGFVISSLAYGVGGFLGGPLVGACCSYVVSTAYEILIGLMRESRASKKHMKEMEQVAKRIKEEQERYRDEYNKAFGELYGAQKEKIENAFLVIINGLKNNDVNTFINGIQCIADAYGIKYEFESFEMIDKQMQDENYVWDF